MRFLIAFTAILGYAAAGLIAPIAYHANAGDVQAAAIDATVAAQDNARAFAEGQARHAEAVHLHQSEAVRQAAEANRDIQENAYWNGLAHSQNVVAAAQSQAAAYAGHAAGYAAPVYGHAAGYAAPVYGHAAPLAYAAPYAGLGYPGYRGW